MKEESSQISQKNNKRQCSLKSYISGVLIHTIEDNKKNILRNMTSTFLRCQREEELTSMQVSVTEQHQFIIQISREDMIEIESINQLIHRDLLHQRSIKKMINKSIDNQLTILKLLRKLMTLRLHLKHILPKVVVNHLLGSTAAAGHIMKTINGPQ